MSRDADAQHHPQISGDFSMDLVLSPCEPANDPATPITPPPSEPYKPDVRRRSSVFINVMTDGDVECSTPRMFTDAHEQMVHINVPATADLYLNYELITEARRRRSS